MASAKGQSSFFKNKIINLNTNINDSVDLWKGSTSPGWGSNHTQHCKTEPMLCSGGWSSCELFLTPLTPVPVPGCADAATTPTGWLPGPSSGWNINSKYWRGWTGAQIELCNSKAMNQDEDSLEPSFKVVPHFKLLLCFATSLITFKPAGSDLQVSVNNCKNE